MKDFQLIDRINTAVVVIDKNMIIVEANKAYQQRSNIKYENIIGKKCSQSAYKLNDTCNTKTAGSCPAIESFKTKKPSSTIHHLWVDDHAVVEEIITTPIIEKDGEINFVVEEFRDISKLLGLKNGIIGICSYCRKIRDTDGKWRPIESYINKYTGAHFSHGICEECSEKQLEKI